MPESTTIEYLDAPDSLTNPDKNWVVYNTGYNVAPNFNFMLRVEGLFDLPCRKVHNFTKANEYEYIQEGGLNDYVHMRRKPNSQPFTFQVERYVGIERIVDPLQPGTDLILPIVLLCWRLPFYKNFTPFRIFTFTGCTVMSKEYGEMNAEQSGLMTETTTIGYRELMRVTVPDGMIPEPKHFLKLVDAQKSKGDIYMKDSEGNLITDSDGNYILKKAMTIDGARARTPVNDSKHGDESTFAFRWKGSTKIKAPEVEGVASFMGERDSTVEVRAAKVAALKDASGKELTKSRYEYKWAGSKTTQPAPPGVKPFMGSKDPSVTTRAEASKNDATRSKDGDDAFLWAGSTKTENGLGIVDDNVTARARKVTPVLGEDGKPLENPYAYRWSGSEKMQPNPAPDVESFFGAKDPSVTPRASAQASDSLRAEKVLWGGSTKMQESASPDSPNFFGAKDPSMTARAVSAANDDKRAEQVLWGGSTKMQESASPDAPNYFGAKDSSMTARAVSAANDDIRAEQVLWGGSTKMQPSASPDAPNYFGAKDSSMTARAVSAANDDKRAEQVLWGGSSKVDADTYIGLADPGAKARAVSAPNDSARAPQVLWPKDKRARMVEALKGGKT
ncbi:MAG: hypothetical protein IK115_03645 [Lachnospiraceae bacterium]|nr:hypothetical protein [Lachnospiraceae bacterium]